MIFRLEEISFNSTLAPLATLFSYYYHRTPAMSDTASPPGTMRGWAIRAYGEEKVGDVISV